MSIYKVSYMGMASVKHCDVAAEKVMFSEDVKSAIFLVGDEIVAAFSHIFSVEKS